MALMRNAVTLYMDERPVMVVSQEDHEALMDAARTIVAEADRYATRMDIKVALRDFIASVGVHSLGLIADTDRGRSKALSVAIIYHRMVEGEQREARLAR